MKLVTLMENTALSPGFACEHGLSLYLETGENKILFDAGQSGAFADNARTLGIDLEAVDLCVLSHGHYDHGGGLGRFLEENSHAKIYVNCNAFAPHYNAAGKYIGLDLQLQKNSRLCVTDGGEALGKNLHLLTLDALPMDTSGLTVMENGQLRPEDFRHEQYLLVEERGKKILISGCSHKGILNIMETFRPDILVGGFHFMKLEDEVQLEHYARELLAFPTTYYTGHCTGERQFAVLKAIMGQRLHGISAGSVVEI